MNLPNKLTLSRIVMTVFFVMALLLPHFPFGKTVAFVLFLTASFTDWWDGWLARRRKITTDFGIMLDPLADKILTCAAFICLVEIDAPGLPPGQHNLVQAWMAVVIIGGLISATLLTLILLPALYFMLIGRGEPVED